MNSTYPVPKTFSECFEILKVFEASESIQTLNGVKIGTLVGKLPENLQQEVRDKLREEYSTNLDILLDKPLTFNRKPFPEYYEEIAHNTRQIFVEMKQGSDVPSVYDLTVKGHVDADIVERVYNRLLFEFTTRNDDGTFKNYVKLAKLYFNLQFYFEHTGNQLHKQNPELLRIRDTLLNFIQNPPVPNTDDSDSDDDDLSGYETANDGIGVQINIGQCFTMIGAPNNTYVRVLHISSHGYSLFLDVVNPFWYDQQKNRLIENDPNRQKEYIEKELNTMSYLGQLFNRRELKQFRVTIAFRETNGMNISNREFPDDGSWLTSWDTVNAWLSSERHRLEYVEWYIEIEGSEWGKVKMGDGQPPWFYTFRRRMTKRLGAGVVLLVGVGIWYGIAGFGIDETGFIADASGATPTFVRIALAIGSGLLQLLTIPFILTSGYFVSTQLHEESPATMEGLILLSVITALTVNVMYFGRATLTPEIDGATGSAIVAAASGLYGLGTTYIGGGATAGLMAILTQRIVNGDILYSFTNVMKTVRTKTTNDFWKVMFWSSIAVSGVEAAYLAWYFDADTDRTSLSDLDDVFGGWTVYGETQSLNPIVQIIYSACKAASNVSLTARIGPRFEQQPKTLEDVADKLQEAALKNFNEGIPIPVLKLTTEKQAEFEIRQLPVEERTREKVAAFKEVLKKSFISNIGSK